MTTVNEDNTDNTKESSSWKTSSVSREKFRMKQIKRWNDIANELQLPAEASESIEPNNNDMKLNSTANTFSKIFQPECNEQT